MSQNAIAPATLADAARQFTRAFNENDLDAVMEWFAEDSVYDQFDGAQARGLAEIRRAFEPQFAGAFGVMKFIEEDLFIWPLHPLTNVPALEWERDNRHQHTGCAQRQPIGCDDENVDQQCHVGDGPIHSQNPLKI